jgi:hypothetical protein
MVRSSGAGEPASAEELGRQVAEELLSLGAAEILAEIYGRA